MAALDAARADASTRTGIMNPGVLLPDATR